MSTDTRGDRTIDLQAAGPSAADWAAVLHDLPPFDWRDARRLVVVSPHPDDETLGAGGLIATAIERRLPVVVVSVTDGEAASEQPDLAAVRRAELTAALACLAHGDALRCERLGLPDGEVSADVAALGDHLGSMLRADDLVACPLDDDGHPDHESTARAAGAAATASGATLRAYPVWGWHCHEPQRSQIGRGERLTLSPAARRAKQAAIACYASQLTGPDPVVPASMLERLDRSFELYVAPEAIR